MFDGLDDKTQPNANFFALDDKTETRAMTFDDVDESEMLSQDLLRAEPPAIPVAKKSTPPALSPERIAASKEYNAKWSEAQAQKATPPALSADQIAESKKAAAKFREAQAQQTTATESWAAKAIAEIDSKNAKMATTPMQSEERLNAQLPEIEAELIEEPTILLRDEVAADKTPTGFGKVIGGLLDRIHKPKAKITTVVQDGNQRVANMDD